MTEKMGNLSCSGSIKWNHNLPIKFPFGGNSAVQTFFRFFLFLVCGAGLLGCGAVDLIRCSPTASSEKKSIGFYPLPPSMVIPDSEGSIQHKVFIFKNESASNPPILLLHELPGLTAKTLEYAKDLQKDFTVYVPLLFGKENRESISTGLWNYFANGEWVEKDVWIDYQYLDGRITGKKTPTLLITNWLRRVVQWIGEHHPGQSIGVIGMCLTGAIPLALLDNPQIRAVVVAQPTLPFMFWGTEYDKRSLGLSLVEIENAQRRVKNDEVQIYGVRFEHDCIARIEKFEHMKKLFGSGFLDRQIRAEEYNYKENPNAHSTLIGEYVDGQKNLPSNQQRKDVLEFLNKRLSHFEERK